MEGSPVQRRLVFVGSSRKELGEFPGEVTRLMGYALFLAQNGRKHPDAKPLTGDKDFAGAGVLELASDHRGNTYRAVHTVRYEEAVYLLHAFQKKSTSGISTAKREVDLVKSRLRDAKRIHDQYVKKEVQG